MHPASEMLEDPGDKALALRDIANARAAAGQFSQAIELAREIEGPENKPQALREIAAALNNYYGPQLKKAATLLA